MDCKSNIDWIEPVPLLLFIILWILNVYAARLASNLIKCWPISTTIFCLTRFLFAIYWVVLWMCVLFCFEQSSSVAGYMTIIIITYFIEKLFLFLFLFVEILKRHQGWLQWTPNKFLLIRSMIIRNETKTTTTKQNVTSFDNRNQLALVAVVLNLLIHFQHDLDSGDDDFDEHNDDVFDGSI